MAHRGPAHIVWFKEHIHYTPHTSHPHTHSLQTADATPWVNTIWCRSGNTSFAQVSVSNYLPRAKGGRSPLISTMCSASHSHLCPNKGGPCGRTQGLCVRGPGTRWRCSACPHDRSSTAWFGWQLPPPTETSHSWQSPSPDRGSLQCQ